MIQLNLDLNIDKHDHPTLVIECPKCKHELTHHLKTLIPDSTIQCNNCQTVIDITASDLRRAKMLYQQILNAEDGLL